MGSGRRVGWLGTSAWSSCSSVTAVRIDALVEAHLQVIWQKAQVQSTGEVARNTGFKLDWVRRLVHRYNRDGPDSLGDRRRSNCRDPLLSEAQRRELLLALSRPAPDGGCGRAARWRAGWQNGSATRSGRSAAGSTCETWG